MSFEMTMLSNVVIFHRNCIKVSEIFSVEEWCDLETGVGVVHGYCIWRNSIDHNAYDFLLVGHCKYSSMLYHFRVISRWIIVTFKSGLEVTEGHSNWYTRKLGYGLLFASHRNYGSVLHHFRDNERYLSKIWFFPILFHSTPSSEYCRPVCYRKTRKWLPDGEKGWQYGQKYRGKGGTRSKVVLLGKSHLGKPHMTS